MFRIGIVVAAAFLPAIARAQSVLAPPANMDDFVRPTLTGTPPPAPTKTTTSPFQLGRLIFRPLVSYRYLLTDGLLSQPGRDSETEVHTATFGVAAELGPRWRFSYNAAQTYYSDDAFDDTLNHFANLDASVLYGEWSLHFHQSFAVSSEPLVETGRQTDQLSFGSTLQSSFRLTPHVVLSTDVSHQASETMTEFIPDTRQWSATERLMYQFSSRIEIGASLAVGYVIVKPGADSTFLRPQLETTWEATDKLSLELQAGYEQRSIRDEAEDTNSPTLSTMIHYRPFEQTTLFLEIARGIDTSFVRDTLSKYDRWSFGWQQRLLGRLQLRVGYSDRDSEYISTLPGLEIVRNDRSRSVDAAVTMAFLERATVTLSYRDAWGNSTSPGLDVDSRQFGVEIGYRY